MATFMIVSKPATVVHYSPSGVAHVELGTVLESQPCVEEATPLRNLMSFGQKFRIHGKTRAKRLARLKNSDESKSMHRHQGKRFFGQKPKYKTNKKGSPRFGRLLQQDFESYWAFCDADRLYYEAMLAADMAWTEQEEALFEQAWYEAEQELERLEDLYWDEIIDGYRLQQEAA